MMGGRAFILLKTGCTWPEKRETASNPPRQFAENFTDRPFRRLQAPVSGITACNRKYLLRFPPDMANLPEAVFLLSRSHF
jgi:hypothetical protein